MASFLDSVGDFFEDAVDEVAGVFKNKIDLEIAEDELRIAKQLSLIKAANAAEVEARNPSGNVTGGDISSLLRSPPVLILGAGLLVMAFFAFRR